MDLKGIDLVGLKYEPSFPFFNGQKNAFVVLAGNFITTEDGTGIVHMAPGFGEDDHALCIKNNIDVVCPVDESGKFEANLYNIKFVLAEKEETLSLAGRQVFETNDDIIKFLKSAGLWIKTEEYIHNYPHCWRTDTPIIYKAVKSWYVDVPKFRSKMCDLNKNEVNWIPHHVRDGAFGNWISNAREWSVSRNRFWGCPVPVWASDNPKYPRIEVYGSIKELEEAFGTKVLNLHRPFIDELIRPNPDDKTGKTMMRRIEDVLDCWFESGSMPFASAHYPFKNKTEFDKIYPADCISEYAAQTRGWFYTLTVLGTALFNKIPFKTAICHGTILDANGQKLSKRLRNYPDPMEMFNTYGSDSIRFAMVKSPVMKGREVRIDANGTFVRETARMVVMPLWNAAQFFQTYLKASGLNDVKGFCTINELSSQELEESIRMYNLPNPPKHLNKEALLEFIKSTISKTKSDDLLQRFDIPNGTISVNEAALRSMGLKSRREKILFSFNSTNEMDQYIFSELHTSIKTIDEALEAYDTQVACEATEAFIETMNNWYIRCNKARFNVLATRNDNELKSEWNVNFKTTIQVLANSRLKVNTNPDPKEGVFFILQNKQKTTSFSDDEFAAFQTLFTVLLIFTKAVAPLLPYITEQIYLDLIGFSPNNANGWD